VGCAQKPRRLVAVLAARLGGNGQSLRRDFGSSAGFAAPQSCFEKYLADQLPHGALREAGIDREFDEVTGIDAGPNEGENGRAQGHSNGSGGHTVPEAIKIL